MPQPGLDDPIYRRFAWGRYRKLMRWMIVLALASVAVGLLVLYVQLGELRLHVVIAASLGIFFTVVLGTALMGLVFLSSGTGHDETIIDPFEDLNP